MECSVILWSSPSIFPENDGCLSYASIFLLDHSFISPMLFIGKYGCLANVKQMQQHAH